MHAPPSPSLASPSSWICCCRYRLSTLLVARQSKLRNALCGTVSEYFKRKRRKKQLTALPNKRTKMCQEERHPSRPRRNPGTAFRTQGGSRHGQNQHEAYANAAFALKNISSGKIKRKGLSEDHSARCYTKNTKKLTTRPCVCRES